MYQTRTALHIPDTVQAWESCASSPEWQYPHCKECSYDIYSWLHTNHPEIRIMIYSGDTDGVVPTVGTIEWIKSLNWPEDKDGKWAPYYWGGQVAGYQFKVGNQLTFKSIQGCGHMAPQWKRPQAYTAMYDWLLNP